MKIVCILCKKMMGEQEPWDDLSEKAAKCPSCIEAEKEEAIRKELRDRPMRGREILFQNGWKGIISLGGTDTRELSFWDLEVGGKYFFCAEPAREDLQKYLARINEPDVDVMFLHSIQTQLPPKRGKRKKTDPEPPMEKEESKTLCYNCTVRVPKDAVMSMFDDKDSRLKQFIKTLAKVDMRARERELQSAEGGQQSQCQESDMSGPDNVRP